MNDIYIPIIFWALSYMPGNAFHYTVLGLVVTSTTIVYIANHQSPLYKLRRVEDAIELVKKTLEHAKATCTRDQIELMHSGWRLASVKLSASKIQTRILETRRVETWEEYLQNVRRILQSIDECAKQVKEIQTSTLLTIEAERQRQISEDIDEVRDTINATVYSSIRRERTLTGLTPLNPRRRFESETTGNTLGLVDESDPAVDHGGFGEEGICLSSEAGWDGHRPGT
ncbi:hypothetical protein K438DRAFT_1762087 [Mycena galopus ATCC 62051]|nr:hypothetical protein K438DRAFT_1762087 [Mycena galopus ATCC 62051]